MPATRTYAPDRPPQIMASRLTPCAVSNVEDVMFPAISNTSGSARAWRPRRAAGEPSTWMMVWWPPSGGEPEVLRGVASWEAVIDQLKRRMWR